MGCQVIFSPRAVHDLETIVRYISAHNAPAGLTFGEALVRRVETLAAFPESGRIVPEMANPAIREVFHGRYRIVYRLRPTKNVVEVLRFWHAAQGEPQI